MRNNTVNQKVNMIERIFEETEDKKLRRALLEEVIYMQERPPAVRRVSKIRRFLRPPTIGEAIALVILLGFFMFFLIDSEAGMSDILTIIAVAIVIGTTGGLVAERKGIIIDDDDPYEPGSTAYFTFGPGSEK